MSRDACDHQPRHDGVLTDRVEEARVQAANLKRAVAVVALAVGGTATVAWVVLLGWGGWDLIEALSTKTLRLTSNSPSQHASAAPPKTLATGYKQPSVLK
jgi:hypothetical protein